MIIINILELIAYIHKEIYKLDVSTRKLMSMHGSFSVNSDVDRLYVPRKFGGSGLVSVSFAIQHGRRNLSFYVLVFKLLSRNQYRL